MDHDISWFSWFPGYQALEHLLDTNYRHTILFPGGGDARFETVHHIYAAAMVVLFLLGLSLYARTRVRDLEKAIVPPSSFGAVAFFELVLDALMGMMKGVIGPEYKRYVPLIGTLALFILCSNLLGLIPGFVPPTDNLNTTLACGLVVFVYFNLQGLRVHGIGHITHLANPTGAWWGWFLAPLMFPLEVISLSVRPISLSLRLAGNMIGDHKVLFAFAGLVPILVPLPFYALGMLVCFIQTAVFCILSTVYIGLHTAQDEHH